MASTNKTNYLGLNQWVRTDPVLMEDFNEDNKKIDSSLQALANALGSSMEEIMDSACQIAVGSYTGTGLAGVDNPCVIEAGFAPKVVLVRGTALVGSNQAYGTVMIRPMETARCDSGNVYPPIVHVIWGDAGVSWYNTTDYADQLNSEGEEYFWAAMG